MTVKIYNASSFKWSGANKVVKFVKVKKKRKVVKNKSNGTYVTTRVFKIRPLREGAVNIKSSVGSSYDRCFISTYSKRSTIDAFVQNKEIKLYNGAGDASGYKKKLKKNTRVKVVGKCTGGWFYVKAAKTTGFVKKSSIVYLTLNTKKMSLYRYNDKSLNAYLQNSQDDNKISFSASNSKAKVSTVSRGTYKQGVVWANKPGSVTITAKYKIAGNSYIKTSAKVKVKDVRIVIRTSSKNLKAGKSWNMGARVPNVRGADIRYSSSNSKVATVDGNGNIRAKKKGTATITASYRGLAPRRCKIKVNGFFVFD